MKLAEVDDVGVGMLLCLCDSGLIFNGPVCHHWKWKLWRRLALCPPSNLFGLPNPYVPSRSKYRPVKKERINISFFYFYPRTRRRMKSAIGSAALRLQRCPRVRAPPAAGRREGRRRGRRQRPRRGCGLRRTPRPIRSSDVFSRSLFIGSQFWVGYLLRRVQISWKV